MEIQHAVSLKSYNTFGIDVKAEGLAVITSVAAATELLPQLRNTQTLILGGGSNLLFTKDFPGIIILNQFKGIEVTEETENHCLVKCGAGENWHSFVMTCVERNLGGLENLSLIPGNVGASPMQNIGAYGVEIKDCFHSLEALHLETGRIDMFDNAACKFGYRESIFKNELKGLYLITSVAFKLSSRNHAYNIKYGAIAEELAKQGITEPTLRAVSNAVIAIRKSKLPDPAVIGNAGSFFKNPVITQAQLVGIIEKYPDVVNYPAGDNKVKLAAGWLIEKAGWKGFRKDDAGVHVNQALVLVNYGNASGSEIWALSQAIVDDIAEKFGVPLEREVNIW